MVEPPPRWKTLADTPSDITCFGLHTEAGDKPAEAKCGKRLVCWGPIVIFAAASLIWVSAPRIRDPPIDPPSEPTAVSLSIMAYDTYLMAILPPNLIRKPDMEQRARLLGEWFQFYKDYLPDVLVLGQIWSGIAQKHVIQKLCVGWKRKGWTGATLYDRASRHNRNPIIKCGKGSLFAYATRLVGFIPFDNPGVVVFVKNELKMESATFYTYSDLPWAGAEKLSRKGYWIVQVEKESHKFLVVATHACGGRDMDVKILGFREMSQSITDYVSTNKLQGVPVIIAGNLNVDHVEIGRVLDILGAEEANDLDPETRKDQKKLQQYLKEYHSAGWPLAAHSSDPTTNYYTERDGNVPNHRDHILILQGWNGEWSQDPKSIVVKVQSEKHSKSNLSDHHAVFSRLEFKGLS